MCTFISSMHTFISCFKGYLFDTNSLFLFFFFFKSLARILLFPFGIEDLPLFLFFVIFFSLVVVDFSNESLIFAYICLYVLYMEVICTESCLIKLFKRKKSVFFTFHCRHIKNIIQNYTMLSFIRNITKN